MEHCPCGINKSYSACCGLFINGNQLPATPEQLMRSRYTAYTQANISYISQTMCGPAAQHFSPQEAESWARQVTWLGLKVLRTNFQNDRGFVEFIASYSDAGKRQKIHEISQFQLINNRWFYIDGKNGK